jgi:uncharacterized protein
LFETSTEEVPIHSSLRAPLRVAHLGRRGRGVVADRQIEEGELVERSPVVIIPHKDRDVVDATHVGNYIFMWEHGTIGEDIYRRQGRVAVVLGFSSLINHSDDPNCRFIRHIEALALDTIATRTIRAGEELTFDYGMELWFTPE